jgi:hypothetical protein
LYAVGQIKVSYYPFFDTANKLQNTNACNDNPPTSAYQKKGTSQHGGSRTGAGQQFSASSPARRKKSPVSLADIEAILEILEVLTPERGD